MRKKFSIISGLVAGVAILFMLANVLGHSKITVIKKMDRPLYEHNVVFVKILVEHPKRGEPAYGPWEGYLDVVISDTLRGVGIKRTFDENKADVILNCWYSYGWGLPTGGRHFGDVYFYSIRRAKLVIVDKRTGGVLGEVEYERPFLGNRPPDDFVRRTLGEVGAGSQ